MITKLPAAFAQRPLVVPVAAFVGLVLTWHEDLPGRVVGVVAVFLVGAVPAAANPRER
ncbi:hypothetical protein [Kitasatospora sp. NPDC001683]